MLLPNSKRKDPSKIDWEVQPFQFKLQDPDVSKSSNMNKITYALGVFVAALTGYNVDLVIVIVRTLFGL